MSITTSESLFLAYLGLTCLTMTKEPCQVGQQAAAPRTLQGHSEGVKSVVFIPDGSKLLSGGADGIIGVWETLSGRRLGTLGVAGKDPIVGCLALTPDGRTVAAGCFAVSIVLWDLASGKKTGELDPKIGGSECVMIHPDGKMAASSSTGAQIKLWDLGTGKKLATMQASRSWIFSVAFSPDGKTLVSGHYTENAIRFWDLATTKEVAIIENCHRWGVRSVAISPDGKLLASGAKEKPSFDPDPARNDHLTGIQQERGKDGSVKLWEFASRKLVATLDEHTKEIHSLAFSPDGKLLASASADQTICLWDIAAGGKLRATLRGHTAAVNSVVFSPDGKLLASGSTDKTVKLWDVAGGK